MVLVIGIYMLRYCFDWIIVTANVMGTNSRILSGNIGIIKIGRMGRSNSISMGVLSIIERVNAGNITFMMGVNSSRPGVVGIESRGCIMGIVWVLKGMLVSSTNVGVSMS